MKGRLIILPAVTALLLGGCGGSHSSSEQIKYDLPVAVDAHYEEGVDFSKYRTWMWVPSVRKSSGNERLDDPEFRDVLGTAIQKEMFKRGYVLVDSDPDLVVNGFVSQQKIDKKYIEENFEGEYAPDYYADLPDGGSRKSSWEEGTLMLFIYDAAKGQVVWYGTAQTEVHKRAVDGLWQERVQSLVAQLLDSLPSRGD